MVSKVEVTPLPPFTKYKQRRMEYTDVEYDAQGWADPCKYLPADGDIVALKLERGKVVNGWSVGNRWEGLRLKKRDKVLAWRREIEELIS